MAPRPHRASVSTESALKLFRVSSASTLRELNTAYRRLVRKYHPDYNPTRLAWAHDAMVRINAAYDVAVDYLASVRYEEVQARLDGEIRAHDQFSAVFARIANTVLDGVFTYYQYGLENPHQRTSGTPRIRYRSAVRRITEALDQLDRLEAPNEFDAETLEIFTAFGRAFLECMQLNRLHIPSSSRVEQAAYERYREGSSALDAAIRRAFFRDELSSRKELASPQALAVSLNEYMAIVTKYPGASWVSETALKLCLLDAFQALLGISDRLGELGL
ncbi:MAG: DnaJ domain-containing protein [Spirochaetota bacterium]